MDNQMPEEMFQLNQISHKTFPLAIDYAFTFLYLNMNIYTFIHIYT
jgi:hypothetical protein